MDRTISESDIYRLCGILAIIGLGIIYLSQSYLEPQKTEIGDIDETLIGNSVAVNGSINSVSRTDNAVFAEIEDSTGSIQIVDFEAREMPDKAYLSGYVDVYEGDVQIVVEEIEDLR